MFCRPFSFLVLPVSPFFLLISYFSHLNGSSCIFTSHCETCPKEPNTFALTAQTFPQTISRRFGISVAMLLCYSAISIHCPSGPSHRHQNVTGLSAQSKFLAMTCGTLHIHIIYQPNIVQNVKLAVERMASKPAKIQESSWLTHLECSCLSRSMTLFRLFQASKPCLGRVGRVYDVFHRILRYGLMQMTHRIISNHHRIIQKSSKNHPKISCFSCTIF